MTIKPFIAALAIASAGASQAATVLSEGFTSVSALSGAGWVQVNNGSAPVGTAWFQGNAGVFTTPFGTDDSYAAANFLSTGAATGAVSNWLITPTLLLDSTSTVSFAVRVGGENFLDTLEVRLSTSGAGTNVGSTTTSVGTFTSLLGTYSSSIDNGWMTFTYAAGLASPTSSRIAFRHIVGDVSLAGNYVGLDNVNITAVPEPASFVMLGLGLAGLAAVRLRRRSAV